MYAEAGKQAAEVAPVPALVATSGSTRALGQVGPQTAADAPLPAVLPRGVSV